MPKPPSRAFAKPWQLIEHPESFEIADASGNHLAFVYYEDELSRRQTLHRLSKDEARRMAEQILRLPESRRASIRARRELNTPRPVHWSSMCRERSPLNSHVRYSAHNRIMSDIQQCPKSADFVAKVG